jgi:hypothetical protein
MKSTESTADLSLRWDEFNRVNSRSLASLGMNSTESTESTADLSLRWDEFDRVNRVNNRSLAALVIHLL